MNTKPSRIEYPFVHDKYAFRTQRERCQYIGTSTREQPEWRERHPEAWILRVVQQEASSDPGLAENASPLPAKEVAPGSRTSAQEVQTNGQQGRTGSFGVPSADESPPRQSTTATVPPLTDAESNAPRIQDEIVVGGRRYVSAKCLASMRGISLRTLSRLCAAGEAPPKIKISGNYFELPEPSDRSHLPSNKEDC